MGRNSRPIASSDIHDFQTETDIIFNTDLSQSWQFDRPIGSVPLVNFGPNPYGRQPYPQQYPNTAGNLGMTVNGQGVCLDQATLVRLLDSLVQAGASGGGLQTTLTFPGMTPAETGVFIKNLLELPKDIQALLMMLAFPDEQVTPETMKKMVKDDPEMALLLQSLQQHLGDSTQSGLQKILKMMATARMAGAGGSNTPAEEMFKAASALQQQVHSSPVSALNTMMLLYLPPLVMPQNIQFRFEPAGPGESDGEGQGGGGTKYHLVLFIETATLGKFRVAMGLERVTQITVMMEHDPQSRPILEPLEKALAVAVAEDGLPPPLFTYLERLPQKPMAADALCEDTLSNHSSEPIDSAGALAAQLETATRPPEKPDKKVAVFPNEGVSILVVHAAYQLAKLVFQLDDNPNALPYAH